MAETDLNVRLFDAQLKELGRLQHACRTSLLAGIEPGRDRDELSKLSAQLSGIPNLKDEPAVKDAVEFLDRMILATALLSSFSAPDGKGCVTVLSHLTGDDPKIITVSMHVSYDGYEREELAPISTLPGWPQESVTIEDLERDLLAMKDVVRRDLIAARQPRRTVAGDRFHHLAVALESLGKDAILLKHGIKAFSMMRMVLWCLFEDFFAMRNPPRARVVQIRSTADLAGLIYDLELTLGHTLTETKGAHGGTLGVWN